MKTLDELWYGNISPFEQCTRGDKRLKELLKLVARNREDLDGTLTDKQKETLEKFEECMNEMYSITERDAFSYGFRLGVQLMAESFLLPLGEDDAQTNKNRIMGWASSAHPIITSEMRREAHFFVCKVAFCK